MDPAAISLREKAAANSGATGLSHRQDELVFPEEKQSGPEETLGDLCWKLGVIDYSKLEDKDWVACKERKIEEAQNWSTCLRAKNCCTGGISKEFIRGLLAEDKRKFKEAFDADASFSRTTSYY